MSSVSPGVVITPVDRNVSFIFTITSLTELGSDGSVVSSIPLRSYQCNISWTQSGANEMWNYYTVLANGAILDISVSY